MLFAHVVEGVQKSVKTFIIYLLQLNSHSFSDVLANANCTFALLYKVITKGAERNIFPQPPFLTCQKIVTPNFSSPCLLCTL